MDKKLLRLNRLIELLHQKQSASVKELARELVVSEMTVRRDIEILSANNIVSTAHGQVLYNRANPREIITADYEWGYANNARLEEKDRIARHAASLIEAGDTIIFDVGSTILQVPKYIPDELEFTALCSGMDLFAQIKQKPNIRLIFAGGYYHRATDMCESPENMAMVQNLRANKVFLSAGGVHRELGVTCYYQYEVNMKIAAIQSSKTRILVTDSSKFGEVRVAFYAHLEQLDAVITDTGLAPEWREFLEENGVKLYLV